MEDSQNLRRRLPQHDVLTTHPYFKTETSPEGLGNNQQVLLRAMPCSMQEKRLLRQLNASTGREVSSWVTWQQGRYRAYRQFQEGFRNLTRICQLWKASLDEIEGVFGPGIQSYFHFLKFLFFINFLAVLLITGFILLPVTVSYDTTIFLKGPGAGLECMNYSRDISHRSAWQHLQDIFTGEGYLEHSYLFYGAYNVKQDNNRLYSVHLAYLLSILGYLFACFLWILRRIVTSLVQWLMRRCEFKPCNSARIFTEWDFCIQSPEVATLKQRSIYNDLKIDLAEQIRRILKQQRTWKQLTQLYLLRLLINGVILLLMAAAFYCIHLATEVSQQDAASLSVVNQYLPPVVISIVNVFLPFLFHALVQLEGCSPNTEVNLTLVRCVILKLSSLGMFLFFLGHRVLCAGSINAPQCQPCGYNKLYQCWETHVGQEMYKMTFFSFLTTLAFAFLISLPRRLLAKHSSCALARWLGKEEFLVPHNVLDIVAAQTVIWTGIFFCPLLPLLGCVSIFLTFYIKKYTLFQNCQPSAQLFRASHSKFLFQTMLLLGLFLACTSLGYVISSVRPSQPCGLFANYSTPWQVLPKAMSHLPTSALLIWDYATSNVFCFLLLMLLSLILTVYISQAQANRQVIERLKRQRAQCVQEKWCLVKKLASHLVHLP
ncbi:transmembrane channel-like protein 8 [Eublepharis macularius]|uniref:Transmembrane channel-like protein n=1 Tax=Eublepharis macularius TaxID=481883 RepID=A0AA97JBG0_EUBMA|nr:transmembrane channel-like protein 8 [Eublepharis macularius]